MNFNVQQIYQEGQRILERQRFTFPSSWLYIDNVEGEWGAFNDILKRKDASIQDQVQITNSLHAVEGYSFLRICVIVKNEQIGVVQKMSS